MEWIGKVIIVRVTECGGVPPVSCIAKGPPHLGASCRVNEEFHRNPEGTNDGISMFHILFLATIGASRINVRSKPSDDEMPPGSSRAR